MATLTLVRDWTGSLHIRHFLTLGEHREHVAMCPHGPKSVSRFVSEHTMQSSSDSCSLCSEPEIWPGLELLQKSKNSTKISSIKIIIILTSHVTSHRPSHFTWKLSSKRQLNSSNLIVKLKSCVHLTVFQQTVVYSNLCRSLWHLASALQRFGSGQRSRGDCPFLFFRFKSAPFAAKKQAIDALDFLSAPGVPRPISSCSTNQQSMLKILIINHRLSGLSRYQVLLSSTNFKNFRF